MNKICKSVCIALLAVPAVAAAGDETGCDNVNFGEDVVAKFPNAAKACHGVTMRDGAAYVHYVAEVVAADKETVTVHLIGRDDKGLAKVKFAPARATINVDGKKTEFRHLKRGTRVDLWIEHNRWGLYADPASTPMNIISREDL